MPPLPVAAGLRLAARTDLHSLQNIEKSHNHPRPFPSSLSEENPDARHNRPFGYRCSAISGAAGSARPSDGRAFVLPGTTIRFGLDGIIGLIPVAVDVSRLWYRPISSGKPGSSARQAG